MSEQAYLELQVGTRDFLEAARILRDLPNAAAAAEAGTKKWVRTHEDAAAKAVAAAEKQAAAAERAAQREAQAWNDALQKALGREDRKALAAEKAAQRQAQAAERAAARENEAWSLAHQKALARYERQAEAAEKAAHREASAGEGGAHGGHSGGVFAGLAEGMQGAMSGGFVGAAVLGGGIAVGEKLAETMIEGAREVVHTAVEIDRLKSRLVGVTGSVDEANTKFEELEEMALGKLPAKVDEVQNAFIQLSNVGLGASKEALKSYSNIAAQTGAALGDVTSAVMMASMGNYRSLRQFGIKMKDEGDGIQATFRGTTSEIGKSTESIEKYLQRIGEVEFAGAAERQMETMGGAIKKLDDAWEEMVDIIAKSKVGDVIRTSIAGAAELVFGLDKALEALLYTVSKTPKSMSKARKEAVEAWTNSPSNTTVKPEDPNEVAEKRAAILKDLYSEVEGGSKMTQAQFYAELDRRMGKKAEEPEWGKEKTDEEQAVEDHIQSIIDKLNKNMESKADIRQREFSERDTALKDAQAQGVAGDLDAAIAENFRQYAEEVNGSKQSAKGKGSEGIGIMDIMRKLEDMNKTARDRNAERVAEAGAREYEQIKNNLAKQEDAVKASYEKQKAFLATYTGPDAAELLAANEVLWEKHNAKLKQQAEEKAAEEKAQHDGAMAILLKGDEKIMAEMEKQEDQYAKLLAKGIISEQEFTQLKVQLHIEANQKIADSNMELALQSTQNAEAIFGSLATASKNWGGEQSNTYKAMFAAQKAFAIASATVSMAHGISSAMDKGWPEGIPLALSAAAEGAKILAMISSANYSGAHDKGGYIPSGSVGLVGEYGPEFVRGPANVTSRRDTARILDNAANGGGGQSPVNLRVVVAPEGHANQYRVSSAREKVIVADLRKNPGAVRRLQGGRP